MKNIDLLFFYKKKNRLFLFPFKNKRKHFGDIKLQKLLMSQKKKNRQWYTKINTKQLLSHDNNNDYSLHCSKCAHHAYT